MDPQFRRHLAETYRLSEADVERVAEEFLAHQAQTLEEFVQQRHSLLKRRGLKNEAIFASILAEVGQQRFAAAPLTLRQIRRIIYG